MKTTLKLEELAQFGLGIALFSTLDYAWWWFLVLFLAPDIGMLGYLVNTKVGATLYNLFHHKGIAIAFILLGMFYLGDLYTLIGTILFAHAAFDRALGYGLKYPDSFHSTHLGRIGREE
ncbi:DUF4260 domain-containing protein [Aureisphaera galaxeae]|uniref:DUF4260 domain-containing protein n=1 Tax=Aureisphaera galaxeae TaxID=1538023 RepID=UPI0023501728|nr:DUF4260 domain-containing protein [Aureisphaera galaxeae]MDC8002877.1 DUF4260 domain-containing protein [Aureisphaera galaxeae]